MRKFLRAIIVLLLVGAASPLTAQRYLSEVFTNVNVAPNVMYAHNISVLTGTPTDDTLLMDVYSPAGDSCTMRPLIIYMHAGTELPIVINGATVGTRGDSSVTYMCMGLAKRGYVVASIDYRLGWR